MQLHKNVFTKFSSISLIELMQLKHNCTLWIQCHCCHFKASRPTDNNRHMGLRLGDFTDAHVYANP